MEGTRLLALGFGLTAALVWAVHDLLARKLSQGAALLPMLMVVLASGSVALVLPAAIAGDWQQMTARAWVVSMAAGVAFALAIGGLYRAFSMAPVRVVSPVIGAYPMLSLAIAAAQGRAVTAADWLAVLAIVIGIAIVALSAREADADGAPAGSYGAALAWAAASAAGFAATFALGQEAARLGGDLPTILVTRLVALASVLGLMLLCGSWTAGPRNRLAVLSLMGVMDALALALVSAAGTLPRAEYASVASSLFGVLTILLAWRFLGERVAAVQWVGIGSVFAGIAALSVQG